MVNEGKVTECPLRGKNTTMNTDKRKINVIVNFSMLADDARDRDQSVGTFEFAGGPRLILHGFIYVHKIQLWQISSRTNWTIVRIRRYSR